MFALDLILAVQPSPDPGGTGTQIIIAALASGGLGAILAAIVAGLFSKRKLGAEATEIITKAASGVVTSIEQELKRSEENRQREAAEHESDREEWKREKDEMMAAHAAEMGQVRRVLQLHVAWDALAIAKLAEVDVTLPPAPPLLPPHIGSLET